MRTDQCLRRLFTLALAVALANVTYAAAAPVFQINTPFQIHDAYTASKQVGGESAPVLTSWDWNGGFIATWLNFRSATDKRAFVGFYSSSAYQVYPGATQMGATTGPTSGRPALSAGPVAFSHGTSLTLFSADKRSGPVAARRDIFAQRMTSGLVTPVGAPIGVNTTATNAQDSLFVTRLSNGNALTAFVSHATAASTFDIKGRIINKNAAGVTSDKALTVNTAGAQTPTSLAALTAGRSVLAYVVRNGQSQSALIQRLDATAGRTGNPVPLKGTTGAATYGGAGVASLSGGRFIALWFQPGAGGTASLKGKIFSATGVPGPLRTIGSARIQNTAPTPPKIAVLPDGQIAVVTGGFNAGVFSVQAWLLSASAAKVIGPVNLATNSSKLTPESLVALVNKSFVASWTQAAPQLTATRAMGVRFAIFNCGRC